MSQVPPDVQATRILDMLLTSHADSSVQASDFAAYGEALAQISYAFQRVQTLNKQLDQERQQHAQDLNDYIAGRERQMSKPEAGAT